MKNLNNLYSSKIEFKEPDSIKFLKNCITCGKNTDRYIEKSFYSQFKPYQDFKSNYNIKLPVCLECQKRLDIKKGFYNLRLWITIFLFVTNLIFMITLMINTYAFLFGIPVIIFSFIIPFYYYWKNIRKKLELSEIFNIKFASDPKDKITISMNNDKYIEFLHKINKKNLDTELVENR